MPLSVADAARLATSFFDVAMARGATDGVNSWLTAEPGRTNRWVVAMLVRPGDGRVADMGSVKMRVLAGDDAATNGEFALSEFTGGAGAWTVPHIHRATQESFYVLEGDFTFTCGDDTISAGPGSYVAIPRGTRHTIHAGSGGGRLLTLMVPGGLEKMFFELASLATGAITDPEVRAAVSARHDSVPADH